MTLRVKIIKISRGLPVGLCDLVEKPTENNIRAVVIILIAVAISTESRIRHQCLENMARDGEKQLGGCHFIPTSAAGRCKARKI